MQIFELHFNPKLKEDYIFDSFIYEPESIYEKKLGSLILTGELQNALPSNLKLLDNIAKTIKGKYYHLAFKSPEKALTETLKKGNDFLQEEVKKDNVSWLGNLSYAVFSLKDLNLSFTKTGDLKILLIRTNQINDIGKNLEPTELEPYPVKIFFNIVSGRLNEGDAVLVLTKEVFDFFQKNSILNKLAKIESLDEKKLKTILPADLFSKGEGAKISGICLIILLEKAETHHLKPKEIYYKKKEKISLFKILSTKIKNIKKKFRFLGKIKNLFSTVKKPLKRFKAQKKEEKKKPVSRRRKKIRIKFPKINFSKYKKLFAPLKTSGLVKWCLDPIRKKNLILIASLIILLLIGLLMFK